MEYLPNNAVEAVLEPLDGLGLGDLVAGTDARLAAATLGNALTRAGPNKKHTSVSLGLDWQTKGKPKLEPRATHMQQ